MTSSATSTPSTSLASPRDSEPPPPYVDSDDDDDDDDEELTDHRNDIVDEYVLCYVYVLKNAKSENTKYRSSQATSQTDGSSVKIALCFCEHRFEIELFRLTVHHRHRQRRRKANYLYEKQNRTHFSCSRFDANILFLLVDSTRFIGDKYDIVDIFWTIVRLFCSHIRF